jgi:hypothetical protein
MSLQVALNAVTFLYNQYTKKEEQAQLRQHLLLSLNRERTFNTELIAEAKKLTGETDRLARDLILETKTDMFDAVGALGVSITAIMGNENLNWFSQNSGIAALVAGKYSARLRNVTTKPILIERAYHRLKVMKVYAKTGVPRNADGLEYLYTLTQAAKLATASEGGAFPLSA